MVPTAVDTSIGCFSYNRFSSPILLTPTSLNWQLQARLSKGSLELLLLSIPYGSGWPMGTLIGDRRAFVIKVSVNNVSVGNQSVGKALAGKC